MPVSSETSAKLSESAKSKPRDAKGHFIKAGTDPASTVATEVKTSTPLPTMSNPPPMPKIPPSLPTSPRDIPQGDFPLRGGARGTRDTSAPSSIDAPLVVINNPFKALLHWLDDIRKKQTTTFDLKVSVPLIALPIFLIVIGGALQYMFTLGQKSVSNPPTSQISPTSPTAPQPILISKVGVIKGTYATVLADEVTPTATPQPTTTPVPSNTPTPTFTPTPTVTPSPTPLPPSRFVLVDKDEKIFFLLTPATLSLKKYLNQRVLITGLYDQTKETITIKKLSDIEVLPY